jgi:hypothetical protein
LLLRTVLLALVPSLQLCCSAYADSPRPVQMKLLRQLVSSQCTLGQLSVGNFTAYTLERPWQGNISLISSIPTGRYNGFVRRTTKPDRWRIELTDVPMRDNVQIHVGNFIADGVGCILLGTNATVGACTLENSKAAMDKFKLAFATEAAKLGQPDDNTPIVLVIADQ